MHPTASHISEAWWLYIEHGQKRDLCSTDAAAVYSGVISQGVQSFPRQRQYVKHRTEYTVPTAPSLSLTPPPLIVTSCIPGDSKQPRFTLSLCTLHRVTILAITASK